MDLWDKPVKEITWTDVSAFLATQVPEGTRLDYKQDRTDDIHNLVAAMANTLGGIIIFGAATDSQNRPLIPIAGISENIGSFEDWLTTKCLANIYPPIHPEIGAVLRDPETGKAAIIVRVNESPEAPHAVDGKKRVYVYDRAGSQNKPYSLTEIDRIDYLLRRRHELEKQREILLNRELTRLEKLIPNTIVPTARGFPPRRWISVIPYFPWLELCSVSECLAFYNTGNARISGCPVQRAPGGVLGIAHSSNTPYCLVSVNSQGHIFAGEVIREAIPPAQSTTGQFAGWIIDAKSTESLIENCLQSAQAFYRYPDVILPGLLSVTMGFISVDGTRMKRNPYGTWFRGKPFPDESVRIQTTCNASVIADSYAGITERLMNDIYHAFDVVEYRDE